MCFSESSNLSDEERSALYFISGYVAFKEKLGVCVPEKLTADSEFLQLVITPFSKVFLEASKLIYESTDYELQHIHHIYRRFSNSFFKAFVKKESDQLSKEKNEKQLEKRKLNN